MSWQLLVFMLLQGQPAQPPNDVLAWPDFFSTKTKCMQFAEDYSDPLSSMALLLSEGDEVSHFECSRHDHPHHTYGDIDPRPPEFEEVE